MVSISIEGPAGDRYAHRNQGRVPSPTRFLQTGTPSRLFFLCIYRSLTSLLRGPPKFGGLLKQILREDIDSLHKLLSKLQTTQHAGIVADGILFFIQNKFLHEAANIADDVLVDRASILVNVLKRVVAGAFD